jgi:hypothetical protein|tara:strand:+ start:4301 stop:5161 length:861 start_codon:yes stop_codon:yes gene_type:complete
MSTNTYTDTGFTPPAVMTPDDSQDLTVDMLNYAVFDSEVNQTTIVEKTGVFVLTQDNITVTNSVIDTESFVGNNQLLQGPEASTYNFTKHKAYGGAQPAATTEFINNVRASNGIGLSQIENTNVIQNVSDASSTIASQDVKMFAHVQDVTEPILNVIDSQTYSNELVNFVVGPITVFSYDDNEKEALKKKFGFDYDAVLETPDIPSYTQNKFNTFMASYSEDMRTGALSRVDVVKTTKQLQLDSVAFEEIPTDEVLETTQTVAAATTTVAPTTNTTSDSGTSGGGY